MILFVVFTSLCIALLSSCQDYDLTTEEVLVKTSFERNFKKTFGEIAPQQICILSPDILPIINI